MASSRKLPDACASCKQEHHKQCLADGARMPCGCGCVLSTVKYLVPVESNGKPK